MSLLVLWAACRSGAPPTLVGDLELEEPRYAPLTRVLRATTDVPTRLSVHLEGPGVDLDVRWPEVRTEHEVLLVGAKPDRELAVTATFEAPDAPSTVAETSFRTAPLPENFPDLELVSLDPDRVEPGYRLLSLDSEDRGAFIAGVDAWDGEVAWLYEGPDDLGDIDLTPRGTLVGLAIGALELDLAGEVLVRWSEDGDPTDPAWVVSPFDNENHELTEVGPDEYVVLSNRVTRVDAFPDSYLDPTPAGPANLLDPGIIRFRRDGTELSTWWYSDYLDPGRIGFDALNVARGAHDWGHGNAVVARPGGGWLASSRHQDALFALDADGALEWILSTPAGFAPEFAPYLLRATDRSTRFYHQHGPSFDPDGNLVVFDNHNRGHNPYEPAVPAPTESRVVAYAVDAEAMTVDQLWEWRHPAGLMSGALGNATALPGGTVVACYGFLQAEGGASNESRGLGKFVSRTVEFVPGDPLPVFDLRASFPATESAAGIKTYRSVPTPRLYAVDVEVERRRVEP